MITKSEQVAADLKQATREARECLKDFKAVIKEYHELIDKWKEYVDSRISEEVKTGLDKYQDTLAKAIEEGSQAVFRRFDKIYDLLTTGGDHTQPSIPELIEKKVRIDNLRKKPKDL